MVQARLQAQRPRLPGPLLTTRRRMTVHPARHTALVPVERLAQAALGHRLPIFVRQVRRKREIALPLRAVAFALPAKLKKAIASDGVRQFKSPLS